MKYAVLFVSALALLSVACQRESYKVVQEPAKNISGTWKITDAKRNGTDLTTRFDFTQFAITFSADSFSIVNTLPFIAGPSGKWAFDDPAYPFAISFTTKDSTTAKKSSLLFPVTAGGYRNIIISFSPGCSSNTYQYTLQKAE